MKKQTTSWPSALAGRTGLLLMGTTTLNREAIKSKSVYNSDSSYELKKNKWKYQFRGSPISDPPRSVDKVDQSVGIYEKFKGIGFPAA